MPSKPNTRLDTDPTATFQPAHSCIVNPVPPSLSVPRLGRSTWTLRRPMPNLRLLSSISLVAISSLQSAEVDSWSTKRGTFRLSESGSRTSILRLNGKRIHTFQLPSRLYASFIDVCGSEREIYVIRGFAADSCWFNIVEISKAGKISVSATFGNGGEYPTMLANHESIEIIFEGYERPNGLIDATTWYYGKQGLSVRKNP